MLPTIYTAVNTLTALQESSKLTPEEKHFVEGLVAGKKGKQGWRKLEDLARFPEKQELDSFKKAIQQELQIARYLSFKPPHLHFTYIRQLKKMLAVINSVEEKRDTGTKRTKKDVALFRESAKKFENILHKTITQYQGTLVLPIRQGRDLRLGKSQGECKGYVLEWIKCLLHQKNPFGINLREPPPFKPISDNAGFSHRYPELNHLAVLTKDIATLQRAKPNQVLKEMSKAGSPNRSENCVKLVHEKPITDFLQPDIIADELVHFADKEPTRICQLNVSALLSGHAMGFCKINGNYHFIDSNFGWLSFKSANDFKQWFSFYFKKTLYSKLFSNYWIDSFSLTNRNQNAGQATTDHSNPFTARLIIGCILLLPITILVVLAIVANMLFRHWHTLGTRARQNKNDGLQELGASETKPSFDVPKKTMDDCDGLRKKKEPSSYSRIAAGLDISLQEIPAVVKRAESIARPLRAGQEPRPVLVEEEVPVSGSWRAARRR